MAGVSTRWVPSPFAPISLASARASARSARKWIGERCARRTVAGAMDVPASRTLELLSEKRLRSFAPRAFGLLESVLAASDSELTRDELAERFRSGLFDPTSQPSPMLGQYREMSPSERSLILLAAVRLLYHPALEQDTG